MPSEKPSLPPKRKKRWLRAFILFFLIFLLSLFSFSAWLAATESGLRFGLFRLPALFGTKIQAEELKGTLLEGFEGRGWLVETAGADVKISDFRLKWQPSALRRSSLHINDISAGDIQIMTKPTPPKEDKPSSGLPESIDLPVAVLVDKFQTGSISYGKTFAEQTVLAEKLEARYRYNRVQHRLDIDSFKTPWSESAGAAVVGLKKPFALNTAVYTKGELDNETIHGTTRLWGSLQDMRTDILLDGNTIHLSAKSLLHPFADKINEAVGEIQIKGSRLNPAAFLAGLPKADLDFDATVVPAFSDGIALEGSIDLENSAADFADNNGIPVRALLGEFTVGDNGVIRIHKAEAKLLQQGRAAASGNIDTLNNTIDLNLAVHDLGMADAIRQTNSVRLNGNLYAKGEADSPNVNWQLNSGNTVSKGLLKIETDRKLGQRTLKIEHAGIFPADGGEFSASGYLELFKDRRLKFDAASKSFNPAKINPQLPSGSINGSIALNGELDKQKFEGKMKFAPSVFNGVALNGTADIAYDRQHLSRAQTDLKLGSNSVHTSGRFGRKGDRLNIDIAAPDLSRFGFGLSGLLNAKGFITGSLSDGIKSLETDLNGQARAFRFGDMLAVQILDFKLKGSPDTSKPIAADIKGREIVLPGSPPTRIDTVSLNINGTGLRHRIAGSGSLSLDGKPYWLNLDSNGGLNRELTQWKGTVSTLDIGGAFNLKLQNRINLEAGSERVALSAARWAAMGGSLNLQTFVWDKKLGLTAKGSAQNLHMSELHQFYRPPVEHNLVLGGDWDLAYGNRPRGYLNIVRQGGDLELPHHAPLGISALSLRTRFQDNRIESLIDGQTRFGKISGNVGIAQQFGSEFANAPVSGKIRLDIPDLIPYRAFLPENMQNLTGRANGEAIIGGRAAAPAVSSTFNGTTNYGRADGSINIGQGSSFAAAPLSGRLNIRVDDSDAFRSLLPVGQTVKGRLNAAVTLGGRVDAPLLNGTLNGDNLFYRNQAQGLVLDNGVLRSRLKGRRWVIDSLKFYRGGTVELKGAIELANVDPDVDVDIVFDKYRTLSRPNRSLILSGNAKVRYNTQKGVYLAGRLKADDGLFGTQKSSMPALDDDVVVIGETKPQTAQTTPIYMDLDLDLNDRVRFIAEGLNVTLGGTLRLTARPRENIQGIGTVKVVKGRYKAYGQDLDITKGTISFVGPLSDPNLNIRAERRLSPVGAGIEVLGSLANPRVTLVADEAMSEKDKLSWLILNRASSGSDGDEAALSAAAGALLAGQINDRLGLVDDFGFTSKRSRNAQTGELNPAEQVLTVGKQLTNELYLGYEYSIISFDFSVKLLYQLTRTIQAAVRAGSKSWDTELKYTLRFDHLFGSGKDKPANQQAETVQQP